MEIKVENMVRRGFDERKSWTTVQFYEEGSATHQAFNHDYYGLKKKGKDSCSFVEHVQQGPALWFRGSRPGGLPPGRRIRQREQQLFAEAKEKGETALLTHPSLVMAHDIFNKNQKEGQEGGAKDFLLVSPWQFLSTLKYSNNANAEISFKTFQCARILSVQSPNFERTWEADGQPVRDWPRCSLYNSRCDSTQEDDKQHYFLNIDIDGKHCMTDDETKRKDGKRVMGLFEEGHEGQESRLKIIGFFVKQAFGELGFDVQVTWHKSIGWKPSWRGYAVGAVFKRPSDAKQFMRDMVISKLKIDYACWCDSEDQWSKILDDSPYCAGVDRCLGSAKLDSHNQSGMRFLNTSPVEGVSDTPLLKQFHKCPNEYVLKCLGWIYPRECIDAVKNVFVEMPRSTKPPKRKTLAAATDVAFAVNGSREVEEVISRSLARDNLAENWTGGQSVRFSDKWVEMRPAPGSMYCVYLEGGSHNSDPSKMVFRVEFNAENDLRGIHWLKQRCYSCNNTDNGEVFRKVCPVAHEDVASLKRLYCPEENQPKVAKKQINEHVVTGVFIDFETSD